MNDQPMRRRDFVLLLGAAVTAWSHGAHAQPSDRVRRIGVLMNLNEDDEESPGRVAAFRAGLQEFGWIEGRNVRIDYRWGGGDADRIRKFAAELVGLAPDVILASSGPIVAALQRLSRTVPIVFTAIIDPVGSGRVESLARPGGNATGFASFPYSISGKWMELLKEIAPGVRRVMVLRDPSVTAGLDQLEAIKPVAASFGVDVSTVDVRHDAEIEAVITAFAREPNGGLIVPQSTNATVRRHLIVELASRHHLPAAYGNRYFVTSGGLISYGPVIVDLYRRSASYVDRILKGANPADLAVQMPVKYEVVINLKAAKALGLEVPRILVARADELID
jgi:putative ABC transport system substrate-binding protein